MVQRLKTPQEAWIGLVKLFYMFLAFPFLLFLGVVTFFMALSYTGSEKTETIQFSMLVWAGILIPLGIFISGIRSRRHLLKSVTASLRDPDIFSPGESYEMFREADGKYLGIDTKNGTILYVHQFRKGQVDVVALGMNDWTNCEVEGSKFRLYTKFPDLPCIEISTPWAQRWYDTIAAMRHKQFSKSPLFAEYVANHIVALEHEHSIQIPRLA